MKIFGEVDLSGITKIVINRIGVFERRERNGTYVWVKTAGGKGYNTTCLRVYDPQEMMIIVNNILARPKKKMLPCGDVVVVGNAYRAWPAGETLNIARKED